MVPSNINLWSFSREESPISHRKHALRNECLRTLLCLNDNLNPMYNGKMLDTKRTSILEGAGFN